MNKISDDEKIRWIRDVFSTLLTWMREYISKTYSELSAGKMCIVYSRSSHKYEVSRRFDYNTIYVLIISSDQNAIVI